MVAEDVVRIRGGSVRGHVGEVVTYIRVGLRPSEILREPAIVVARRYPCEGEPHVGVGVVSEVSQPLSPFLISGPDRGVDVQPEDEVRGVIPIGQEPGRPGLWIEVEAGQCADGVQRQVEG